MRSPTSSVAAMLTSGNVRDVKPEHALLECPVSLIFRSAQPKAIRYDKDRYRGRHLIKRFCRLKNFNASLPATTSWPPTSARIPIGFWP
jgi:hypothetical protein